MSRKFPPRASTHRVYPYMLLGRGNISAFLCDQCHVSAPKATKGNFWLELARSTARRLKSALTFYDTLTFCAEVVFLHRMNQTLMEVIGKSLPLNGQKHWPPYFTVFTLFISAFAVINSTWAARSVQARIRAKKGTSEDLRFKQPQCPS